MGQPFFPGAGVSSALGDGVSVAAGDSVGVGVEDAFLRFDFAFGVGVGDGVGEVFLCFGEAVGDGAVVAFFAERFRCLRDGLGVDSGSKAFFIFVPNDSSAEWVAPIPPNNIANIKTHFMNWGPS